MYCSRCGAANPDEQDVKLCFSCGAELAGPPSSQPGQIGYLCGSSPSGVAAQAALAGTAVASPDAIQAASFPYGGFWIRVVAYLIDAVILGIAFFVISALAIAMALATRSRDIAEVAWTLAVAFFCLFGAIYWVICPPLWGATPGKIVVGYHIVDEQGKHIGFGRSTIRLLGTIVSAIPLWLGYIWVAVDSRKQGWHDKIAGTLVVRNDFIQE